MFAEAPAESHPAIFVSLQLGIPATTPAELHLQIVFLTFHLCFKPFEFELSVECVQNIPDTVRICVTISI